jgi:predicted ferric reductase
MQLKLRPEASVSALLLLLFIGIEGGIALAVGLLAQPLSDWQQPATAFTALSRISAMAGAYLALLLVIFMARIPVIEKALGQDKLIKLHRIVGPYSLYLILAHVVFVSVGYAGLTGTNAWNEFWQLIFSAERMLPALAGFIFMMLVGVTSYKRARNRMKYETWWQIHLYSYLGIVLSFFHQVDTGIMFIDNPGLKLWWMSLYVMTFLFILYYRWIQPRRVSSRQKLKVKAVVAETPTSTSIYLSGPRVAELEAQGGQYFNFKFRGLPESWNSRPFSLSAHPTADELRITVKHLGDYTNEIRRLPIGSAVDIEGPYGTFTAAESVLDHVVLIAGGVGITPIRAILEELPAKESITLIWRAHSKSDLPLEAEIDAIAKKRGITIHKLIGPRNLFDFSSTGLLNLAPNIQQSDIFICGPNGLVGLVEESCGQIGIAVEQIHAEAFAY